MTRFRDDAPPQGPFASTSPSRGPLSRRAHRLFIERDTPDAWPPLLRARRGDEDARNGPGLAADLSNTDLKTTTTRSPLRRRRSSERAVAFDPPYAERDAVQGGARCVTREQTRPRHGAASKMTLHRKAHSHRPPLHAASFSRAVFNPARLFGCSVRRAQGSVPPAPWAGCFTRAKVWNCERGWCGGAPRR